VEIREAQGTRWRVAGSGPPLVLVHGLAGSWRWWRPLVDLLSARRQVYVVDVPRPQRLHGFRELGVWLARWLDVVGIERADFAGHSLGGFFTAQLAARQPRRVRRLVLVAPAGISCERALPGRVLPLFGTLYDIRASLPMVTLDALRPGVRTLTRGIVFASRCDVRADLPAVRAPTLLVWGERDRLVPIRLAEDWQRLLPGARLVRLPCGHVPLLETPRELAACIHSFLDE
jgi:pimeloyl-ACP methyl ester carboxylesterase